jgi:hypothetical protein
MSEDGAKLMYDAAWAAYEAGHTIMMEMINGNPKLSERRKIGAAITAATILYESLLEGCNKHPSPDRDMLVLGMFNDKISEKMTKIALREAKRLKGKDL